MDQKQKKKYETEWAFSFDKIGESIGSTLSSLGIGEDVEIKSRQFTEPLEDAESARVVLEPAIGRATVSALHNSDNLIEADLTYVGEVKFEIRTDDTHKHVSLRQNIQSDIFKPIKDAIGSFSRREELHWDMRLTPNIPLDLQINNGITSNDFDLSALQLTGLRINGGTGKTDLKLPTMGSKYPVKLNSGTGELNVDIPDGAALDLSANNGTGKTTLHIGSGADIDAHITGGVGKCTITLPANAAVRVRATTGLGKVRIPENFIEVKVDEFVATSGTWETPNYKTADQVINIRYEGGIGDLTIKLV